MTGLHPIHVRAPGKINVFLEVGDVQDDGYHEVASAYQAVSVFEDVWATPAPDFRVSVSGTVDVSGVPLDGSNLAIRAARLVAAEIGRTDGVHLEIRKNVPVAGGMGGGSADAAAALVACDALWDARLSPSHLHRLAARLGADVPFGLVGGTAIGTGRGDALSPALARGRFDWVIVAADDGLSTAGVYAELDAHRVRHATDIGPPPRIPAVEPAVLQALRAGDAVMLAASVRNDLQPAALHLRPRLAGVLELGERSGALTGIVSGSGPTLAFLVEDEASAAELEATLLGAGLAAQHVHGPVPGAKIVAG